MQIVVGIDVGGTKCAVSFARYDTRRIEFLEKVKVGTVTEDFTEAMKGFIDIIRQKFAEHPYWKLCSIGISCGGPLNARKGLILSPPNLPKWERADVFTPLKKAFQVPVMLQNDADACALAEWTFGAGRGFRNMIFLTFGTGMGAGMILNNELYEGTDSMAGEVGHIRLSEDGPIGYGKRGSFEGFCSGGGIADLGRKWAAEAIKAGNPPLFCKTEADLQKISARSIAKAMEAGDKLAAEIFKTAGCYLGKGLSVLIDILNPEIIVIGSIFARQEAVLSPEMHKSICQEALEVSRTTCKIVPASLGEQIGDYAAVSVGIRAYENLYKKEAAV